jgi:large subunit ribosomal protein L17
MLRNMTNSLLKHEAIKTTLPKAKELRRVVEPLITLGKEPTRQQALRSMLRDRESRQAVSEIGLRHMTRNGG